MGELCVCVCVCVACHDLPGQIEIEFVCVLRPDANENLTVQQQAL